jgi:hypothetical protein
MSKAKAGTNLCRPLPFMPGNTGREEVPATNIFRVYKQQNPATAMMLVISHKDAGPDSYAKIRAIIFSRHDPSNPAETLRMKACPGRLPPLSLPI